MEGTLEEPGIKDSSRNSPDRHLKGEHASCRGYSFSLETLGYNTFESESSGLIDLLSVEEFCMLPLGVISVRDIDLVI